MNRLNCHPVLPGATCAQPHLTAKMFKTMTGVDLLHVPYKGAGPQMIGLRIV